MLSVAPDCQQGAVPPFGELYGLSVYLDEALAEDPEIIFSSGTLSDGIDMGNADFVRLVKPRIRSFAERGNVIRDDNLQDVFSSQEHGGK
jgi:prolyl-tRNA editing enzyme YbaK/EbsC (Cys-tRNA(Pro) deacylase)